LQKLDDLKNYTILYAEDETGIQEEISEILELLFKEVYLASNGVEAQELYLNNKPDLIITDIKMPKLNGLDFIKELRQKDNLTAIAITSAFTDTELILLATELNLLKYIVKPLTKEKLFEIFKKFLDKKKDTDIVFLNDTFIYDIKNSLIKNEEDIYILTLKEHNFLKHILKKNAIVSYEEIEYILEIDSFYNDNAIRQFIKKIRKKLPKGFLKNIQNQGYIISN
jgi:DNA-binding response OmpR family regulator